MKSDCHGRISSDVAVTVPVMQATPDPLRLSVRLSGQQVARLDDLCADTGLSRSAMVRRLVETGGTAATGNAATPRLDRDDLLSILEERARAGSAPAARALLERIEDQATDDELARLRALTTDPPREQEQRA
jgi:hypothetical protein